MMVAWDYIYISKSQVLLMGDFNLDLLKNKEKPTYWEVNKFNVVINVIPFNLKAQQEWQILVQY